MTVLNKPFAYEDVCGHPVDDTSTYYVRQISFLSVPVDDCARHTQDLRMEIVHGLARYL